MRKERQNKIECEKKCTETGCSHCSKKMSQCITKYIEFNNEGYVMWYDTDNIKEK